MLALNDRRCEEKAPQSTRIFYIPYNGTPTKGKTMFARITTDVLLDYTVKLATTLSVMLTVRQMEDYFMSDDRKTK